MAAAYIDEQQITRLAVRHAVLEKAQLVVQGSPAYSQHRVDSATATLDRCIADLGILQGREKFPASSACEQGTVLRTYPRHADRRCSVRRLADVKQDQFNVWLFEFSEEMIDKSHL